jgi:hypothetical protein
MTSRLVRFAILYEKNGENMLPKASKIARLRGVPAPVRGWGEYVAEGF